MLVGRRQEKMGGSIPPSPLTEGFLAPVPAVQQGRGLASSSLKLLLFCCFGFCCYKVEGRKERLPGLDGECPRRVGVEFHTVRVQYVGKTKLSKEPEGDGSKG